VGEKYKQRPEYYYAGTTITPITQGRREGEGRERGRGRKEKGGRGPERACWSGGGCEE
jgi:hypothetical protein